jgi:hypothetical protein
VHEDCSHVNISRAQRINLSVGWAQGLAISNSKTWDSPGC